ncbi:putative cyanidin-3-O-glucoside 2-O-glucuronosyltransferase-like [Capsicum annuum]|uniref:UDP-glucosyltransferase 29 n=1 Tax=Capsicum annuum TaxID=4072 RepID=UPI0007BF549C|nr:UDP-glucosyltransferase 29 [Capsicum annuum]KAF3633379.1 putative cyanidin-3-O-glucoside 2-O-glucuronosyltransferase-like [Capsicum annuum]
METGKRNIRIVMFPWLVHGHIISFLELAKALAKRNFITHLYSTHANLNFFKKTLSLEEIRCVKLEVIQLPYLPEIPSRFHTTNGLSPRLVNTLKKAFLKGEPDFYSILDDLKPDLIIYDFLLPCIPLMASTLNIPAVLFLTTSAASNSYHYRIRDTKPRIASHFSNILRDHEYPFPEIFLRDHEHRRIKKMFKSLKNDGIDEKNGVTRCFERSKEIILIKTFTELEGKYIDYNSFLFNKNFLPVGPLVRPFDHNDAAMRYGKIIEWLNEKEKSSTIFVCFGSECYLSKEELKELALGMELSMVNFLWVIRFPMEDETEIPDVLSDNFLERIWCERGVILESWAPQKKILEHPSIGGFVSHCGWGSVMEALSCGVPIIAMPMQHEQPLNTRLLVNDVGVGLEIQRDEEGNIRREGVAKTIREVVLEESGESVRNKAKELKERMRENGENDIDGVVDALVDLYKKTIRCGYYNP